MSIFCPKLTNKLWEDRMNRFCQEQTNRSFKLQGICYDFTLRIVLDIINIVQTFLMSREKGQLRVAKQNKLKQTFYHCLLSLHVIKNL